MLGNEGMAENKGKINNTEWNTTQQKERRSSYLFATAWMELGSIMLSKISQMAKDKYHMTSVITRI